MHSREMLRDRLGTSASGRSSTSGAAASAVTKPFAAHSSAGPPWAWTSRPDSRPTRARLSGYSRPSRHLVGSRRRTHSRRCRRVWTCDTGRCRGRCDPPVAPATSPRTIALMAASWPAHKRRPISSPRSGDQFDIEAAAELPDTGTPRFGDDHLIAAHLEDRIVRVDAAHTADASERVGADRDQLG